RGPLLRLDVVAQKQRRGVRPDELLVVAGLVVDRQQVVAVAQHDRLAADHRAGLGGQADGSPPGVGAVLGDPGGDARVGPGGAVAGEAEQPDLAVGRLPDDRVALGLLGPGLDRPRRRPLRLALLLAGAVDGGVVAVLAAAAVVG